MNDPYQELGVSKSADKETIKKAYRRLAMLHHPDRGGDEDKFKRVSEAYSILSDDDKRREYEAAQSGFNPFAGGGFNPFDMFRQAAQRQRRTGRDVKDSEVGFNIRVTLDQIKKGSKQRIRYKREVQCPPCKGKGGFKEEQCKFCEGRGMEVRRTQHGFVHIACRASHGTGTVFAEFCGACRGQGVLLKPEEIVFEIKEIHKK